MVRWARRNTTLKMKELKDQVEEIDDALKKGNEKKAPAGH
jgi:hypothetical protein